MQGIRKNCFSRVHKLVVWLSKAFRCCWIEKYLMLKFRRPHDPDISGFGVRPAWLPRAARRASLSFSLYTMLMDSVLTRGGSKHDA